MWRLGLAIGMVYRLVAKKLACFITVKVAELLRMPYVLQLEKRVEVIQKSFTHSPVDPLSKEYQQAVMSRNGALDSEYLSKFLTYNGLAVVVVCIAPRAFEIVGRILNTQI